jgi:hypothetical protein
MATVTKGRTFTSGETVTPAKLNDVVDLATVTEIVNADIKSDAAIAGTKIAAAFGDQDITSSGVGRTISVGSTGGGNNAVRVFSGSGSNGIAIETSGSVAIATNSELIFKTGANIEQTPGTSVAGTERMRIDSVGALLIGKNTASIDVPGINLGSSVGEIRIHRADGEPLGFFDRRGSNGTIFVFRRQGSTVGSISVTTTATTYSTSSDYRLKQNVEPMVGALSKLAALAPKTFEFKAEPNVKVDGFIAHEVHAVVPQAVTGEKDGEEMQGLDHSKLVPVLVAAVQELSAKVAALEAAQNK